MALCPTEFIFFKTSHFMPFFELLMFLGDVWCSGSKEKSDSKATKPYCPSPTQQTP